MTLSITGNKTWKGQRRSQKYNAVRTTIQGETFDSKKEALRWIVLKQMQRDGEITGLQRQVPYDIVVNGVKITRYVADFTYTHRSEGFVTEDAKGVRTPEYRLKAKLFHALFGREIKET